MDSAPWLEGIRKVRSSWDIIRKNLKKIDFQFEKNVVSVEISGINNNENPKTTTAYNMNILQQISVTGNLIEQVPNSDFSNFLGKTIQLLDSESKILDMIEDDLDFKGKAKKAVRIGCIPRLSWKFKIFYTYF